MSSFIIIESCDSIVQILKNLLHITLYLSSPPRVDRRKPQRCWQRARAAARPLAYALSSS